MPELPEVESVRQSLLSSVVGRVITRVDVLTNGVWINDHLPSTGWRIDALCRRGKYLIFELSRDTENKTEKNARLIVHLRMTGQLLLQQEDRPPEKHTHVKLQLDQSLWLEYHDTRRFGRLWLIPADGRGEPGGLASLGLEPLDPDFNVSSLSKVVEKSPGRKLKALLLDQTLIAGLGNIYADEVLFASGLHPARNAGSLNTAEISRLTDAVVTVLRYAVECQGTTLRDYVNGWNQKGTFQNCLMVYGRAGQPCRKCGTIIESARLAGRTTCWCPSCQPIQPGAAAPAK